MRPAIDIERILAHYDLGRLIHVQSAAHGFVNQTAVVVTEGGRFVVRRNHQRFGLPAQRRRHALIGRLYAGGIPTAPLVAARDGETLVVIDGRGCEVQEYIAGDDFDPQCPAQLDSIGMLLAQYHEVAATAAPPVTDDPPRYTPQRIGALVEQLLERDVMGELHDALAWYGDRAAQLRIRLPDELRATLPRTIIHGDIHPDNLRFCGAHVSALLDFDQAATDVRIVDLAEALVAFAGERRPEELWGVFRGPLDPLRAARLCAAYQAHSPLSSAEHVALPVLIECLWLTGELGRVISTPEGAPEYHLAVLDQGHRLAAEL
ncbi:MAG TPA: homoserine kinase [Roseiflexaceae bacterium]|nr:homoserine kinase [Roseiflexaceae bacterium]HMP39118.1 homoserine kinase [Roseiflexaceae bacterium]